MERNVLVSCYEPPPRIFNVWGSRRWRSVVTLSLFFFSIHVNAIIIIEIWNGPNYYAEDDSIAQIRDLNFRSKKKTLFITRMCVRMCLLSVCKLKSRIIFIVFVRTDFCGIKRVQNSMLTLQTKELRALMMIRVLTTVRNRGQNGQKTGEPNEMKCHAVN